MSVIIVTPYDRSEYTHAAIRLADYVAGTGRELAMVTTTKPGQRIDMYWDSRIRTAAKYGIAKHAINATTAVYFHPARSYFDDVDLVASRKNMTHVLVADPYTHKHAELQRYDRIVCPSRVCYNDICRSLAKSGITPTQDYVTQVQWDAGIPPRSLLSRQQKIRLAIIADTTVQTELARFFAILAKLQEFGQRIEITVLHAMQWPRSVRRTISAKELSNIKFVQYCGRLELMSRLRRADWCAVFDTKAVFGSAAMLALACGVPVMANDYGPYRDVVTRTRGVLVPCDTYGANGAVYAGFRVKEWVDYLLYYLKDAKSLLQHLGSPWQIAATADAFNASWNRLLN